ncbi:rCG29017 [Rattus norvegicus]|uniref:RCG29017 n=1 Tax=Rattus norvegicus TaxID=10116 RepID=A6HUR2_RAT|nr:rCG29017 [Rattus norvegicus]
MNGRRILWMFLVLPIIPAVMAEDLCWGLLSVFPKPLSLMHSAQVFPDFFPLMLCYSYPSYPGMGI